MTAENGDVPASGAVLAPSAAARRWARREAGRLLLERADAGLVSQQIGNDDPAYSLDFLPGLARLVEDDLTPDRTMALLAELLLIGHALAGMLVARQAGLDSLKHPLAGMAARELSPGLLAAVVAGMDERDPIEAR